MKAKVINPKSKYYGRIVNVRKMADTQFFSNRYEMVYGKSVFFGDELDFNIAPVNNPVSFDWSSFRREAAKDAMCQIIRTYEDYMYIVPEDIARRSVACADELIKQLQEEKK